VQKPTIKNLEISIIIPVKNDPLNLKKCLQSIANSVYTNYECIVVDDASTDETPDIASHFQIKLLKLPQNHGPAYARNQGAKIASGKILFFVDADVLIYPDTLTKIFNVFNTRPELDAVIGSYDDAPADTAFISQYKNLFHHYIHQQAKEQASTFWSGCGAIRRELFLKINGFDVTFGRPAIEDIELGFRLIAENHKIALIKEIQVKHLKHWSFWGLLKTDIFDRALPWTLIMLRDRMFPKDLNLGNSQRISVFLTYSLLLLISMLPFCPLIIPSEYHTTAFAFLLLILPFLLLLLVSVNHKFYRFFWHKRGFLFTLQVIPLHILYFFYCGVGLIFGIFAHISGIISKSKFKIE